MKILHASWGYNMTINDFCKVISETDKTALCQMVGNKVISGSGYNGEEVVQPKKSYGLTFRLRKHSSSNGNWSYYKGSYPFSEGSDSKRMGIFSEVDPNKSFYYNNVD